MDQSAIEMARYKNWLQILWWAVLYAFWILAFQKRTFSFSRTATIEFCYLIFIAANFYYNSYFTIPRYLYRKRYIAFVVSMLGGIAVGALLRVPLAMYLNKNYFLVDNRQPDFSQLLQNSFLNIFIWVVCIVSGKLIIDRSRFQRYVDEMEKEREKVELDFLNAQFNPHFLFNSINSIYVHIDKSNVTARNMLLTFSEMLRYQLYDCNSNSIGIDKEMGYIKNYVALQQARKEESMIVNLFIANNVKGFAIAPLLFVAFIENAFKYVGSSDERENRVDISFYKEGDDLFFRSFNTKDLSNINRIDHKGIGIANAKRRLALLYPGKHNLAIKESEYCYEATLKILLS